MRVIVFTELIKWISIYKKLIRDCIWHTAKNIDETITIIISSSSAKLQ